MRRCSTHPLKRLHGCALSFYPCMWKTSQRDARFTKASRGGITMTANVYDLLDDRFRRLYVGTARLDMLFVGCRWAEGPAYFPAGRHVVWSDIPNNRMMRLDECSGAVSVFRQPSGNSNGNTVDRSGRLVTCEHGGRRVARTETGAPMTTMAAANPGQRTDSPN